MDIIGTGSAVLSLVNTLVSIGTGLNTLATGSAGSAGLSGQPGHATTR